MKIVEYLSDALSLDAVRINNYIATCPHRYKRYTIPKRNSPGQRLIAQPAKELKVLQRVVCGEFLSELPVHESCTAYRKNRSIRDNAIRHAKHNYLLKMDFKDFFPSIIPLDLIHHVTRHIESELCEEDKTVLGKLFFFAPDRSGRLVLSIGAPTSPFISNTIMHEFDTIISQKSMEKGIIYTRYADDITFSTNKKNILFEHEEAITETLNKCEYPTIRINENKTVFLSRKDNMHVTGLVLSNDGKVSIGRKKKKYIRSLIYQHINQTIGEEEKSYLVGYLSFCWSVEPEFIARLENKYGKLVICALRGIGNG